LTALPNVNDVVRIVLDYTNNAATGKIINRMDWLYTGAGGTGAEMLTLATNISGYWGAHCADLAPSESALASVTCTDLTTTSSPTAEFTSPVSGTRSGTQNSAQVAFLVSKKIATRYRGGKPKTFLPYGTASDLLSVGAWESTFVASVTGGWNAFVAAITADASYCTFSEEVCVSYYGPPNVVITNPVTGRARTVSTQRAVPLKYPIVSYEYEAQVATQRRRTGRKR
jgi:hypothetical protein